jgi:MFS family permease
MARGRPWTIYVSATTLFAGMTTRNLLLPLRVHELGGSRLLVGLAFTVFTVVAAVVSLPAGLLSDRLGRRALVMGSAIIGGASQVGLAVAGSATPILVWQAVAGLAGGAAQAGLYAAVADVIPVHRLGRAIGYLTLAMQVGFVVGPALAGVALTYMGLHETLLASAGLFAITVVLSWLGVPVGRRSGGRWALIGPVRQVASQPGFVAMTVGLLAATMLWGTLQAYLVLFATEQLGLPAAMVGYMVALMALTNGLSRLPAGWLVDRVARPSLIVVAGVGGFALALAGLPYTSGFWAPTLWLGLTVPLIAITYIAIGVAFTRMATPRTRGVAMGLYGAVLFAGLGLGPAAFGPVMQAHGYTAGFAAAAVAGILGAAAVALVGAFPKRSREQPVDDRLTQDVVT